MHEQFNTDYTLQEEQMKSFRSSWLKHEVGLCILTSVGTNVGGKTITLGLLGLAQYSFGTLVALT